MGRGAALPPSTAHPHLFCFSPRAPRTPAWSSARSPGLQAGKRQSCLFASKVWNRVPRWISLSAFTTGSTAFRPRLSSISIAWCSRDGSSSADSHQPAMESNLYPYLVTRGPAAHETFVGKPAGPWNTTIRGTETIEDLRTKLFEASGRLAGPIEISVEGVLFPCALLSSGWWEKRKRDEDPRASLARRTSGMAVPRL